MEKIDFNKHFIASIDTKSTQKIKVTQDLKEFFKFIASNPDAKAKEFSLDLKMKYLSKKDLFKLFYNFDKLRGLRYLEIISKNELLLRKYRSMFGIDVEEWNAFKRVEDKML
ncbi:hypothetical protein [uncultured Flavobacterium sp.]|uniref:hypothetical protein n=1 Tax=uncultured Flavobacterium sp. TaxID=165435 RepID=UPI0030EE849B|tara:strand:- start:275 stop:610 length:336 start_codon:yes stop_codon:yes gene_type:complete